MIAVLFVAASIIFIIAGFVALWRGKDDLLDSEAAATTRKAGWCLLGAWVCLLAPLVIYG